MKAFFATDSVSHNGNTNVWLTPRWLIESLGEFDLDPCAAPSPRPWNTAKQMNELPNCGLALKWQGRVWLNPPYGGDEIQKWTKKLIEHKNGIALVFARTDTKWFQEIFSHADGTFLLKGRIRFCQPNGQEKTTAGTGSVLFAFGKNNCDAIEVAQNEGLIDGIFVRAYGKR